MQKLSTFIRKFDVNHVDGDPLYGHALGYLTIITMWFTIFLLIIAMAEPYLTVAYFNEVVQTTLTNICNNYGL